MDALTTIAGVASATKATIEAVRAVLAKGKGRAAETAAQEALGLIGELQTRLLQLQEMAFRLHQEKAQALEENAKLRADIRQKEERAADRQKYQRQRAGDAWALVRADQPGTYFCEVCLETKGHGVSLTAILPEVRIRYAGTHQCPSCGGVFNYR